MTNAPATAPTLNLAIVGAGPVGLSLALHAAHSLPNAAVTVFDARSAELDIARDPRTLALSLGSVQLLQRLGHVGERRAVAQRPRLALQQRDVVLPVVAGLAGIAEPLMVVAITASSATTTMRPGYSRVLTICPASSHGTE